MNCALANISPSLIRRLRYLEWVFLTTHFIFSVSSGDFNILLHLAVYSIFIASSYFFPSNFAVKWRQAYILSAMISIAVANVLNISLDMLLYIYIAKSFFLIGGKRTIWTTIVAGIVWVASECYSELQELEQLSVRFEPPFGFGNYNLQSILIFSLALYTAVAIFTIYFSSVIVAEQQSRKRAEALTEQVEIMAINLERTRIARDIHDSLGHTLTDLDIQLKVAKKMRSRNLDNAWSAIDKASLLSAQCIEDVSHAVQTMRRNDFDLTRALTNLVEQIRNDSTVEVYWNIDLPQLSLSVSHQIYCILKEGLNNIKKHSRASQISFRAYSTSTEVILKLKDNGIGFDPKTADGGFGLQGMAERVRGIKGRLEINSTIEKGTEILVTVPR